ncbi:ariadne-1 [Fragilaria crotonensis]|nr:ariadne-1 [Fragilaria crotonensis]
MTEEEVLQAAPDLLPKFENYQLRSFVESNTLTRWCPGRGCERVAIASSASALEQDGKVANCDACSTSFCLVCGEEPHSPCNCKELAVWNEKCRNESETANWILANTKACPKCISRIEKNQGCNHMTCQKCKFEFCWICMGDWTTHGANTGGYYKCNKFDPNSTGDENDHSDAAKAKRELDRYLHYYKRYHAHSEAQAFAKKQLKETETRMILLQESSDNARWSEVEFLKTANEQLIECRRVLKYTYTFAYYLTDDTKKMQKECFEYHQEMLERFTENLSELSEAARGNGSHRRGQPDARRRSLHENILKYVEDGMEDMQPPAISG